MRSLRDLREVGQASENVGILHHDAAGVAVDPRNQPVIVGPGGQAGRRTGDLVVGKSPLDLTKEEKRRREDEAEQKILALGGPSDLAALWDEYREGTTLEARLVKDCDRLEMGLQAVGYREVGELSVEGAAAFLTEDADYQTAMVRALLGR